MGGPSCAYAAAMSISVAPAVARCRRVRLVPLGLLALGVVLALVALFALPWYAVDLSPTPPPGADWFLVLPGDTDQHAGVVAWVLVLIAVVTALGSLLPRPGVALACRAGAPAVAAGAVLWVLGDTLLTTVIVSAADDAGWPVEDVSLLPGLVVEVVGLVLLGVGAALGPRRSDLGRSDQATSEVRAAS